MSITGLNEFSQLLLFLSAMFSEPMILVSWLERLLGYLFKFSHGVGSEN